MRQATTAARISTANARRSSYERGNAGVAVRQSGKSLAWSLFGSRYMEDQEGVAGVSALVNE